MFTQELIYYEFGAVQINDVNDVWMYTAETFFRCRSVFYSLKQTKLRSNLIANISQENSVLHSVANV